LYLSLDITLAQEPAARAKTAPPPGNFSKEFIQSNNLIFKSFWVDPIGK